MAQELTLVCAPAGFGKTSLLGDWARHAGRPVAWLSLDPGDNDPVRFWRYVAAALERAGIAVAEPLAPLLRGPQPASLTTVVTALINQLATRSASEQVALVLDDYHRIQAPPTHHSLALLLERAPACLRLVLASRADPPLPLARLRARGQLAELRQRELRFTLEETAALLRQTTGLELPAASVAALAARTEGWAVGLQLAGLSLAGHPDPAGFVASFSGSHRYVLDFLAEEVLARQPEPLRQFLLESSVLERVCGPLCQAVCGRADSQQLLEQAERANLFLLPLDEQRRWWRYHHLFADLLRARLTQADPERVGVLHRAAAAWCEQHGLVDDAIGHALAAGDGVWAARLIERHFDALLRRAEGATVDRWVAALPAELVGSRPRLRLAQAVWALLAGRVDEAEARLADAERALAAGGDEPYAPSVGRAASLLANLPASIALGRADLARRRGDADRIGAFARQALAQLTEDDRALRLLVDWDLAVADWQHGRVAEAERALVGVVAAQRAAGEGYLAVRPACDLGQVQRAQGRLGAALHTYQQALEIASEAGRPLPPAGMALVGLAEVHYERGELDVALEHATDGVRLCRQLAYTLPLLAGLAVLARIRAAHGDAPGALEALAEAEQVEPGAAAVGLLDPVPPLRARLALARGELAQPAGWARQRGLAADDQPSYPREQGTWCWRGCCWPSRHPPGRSGCWGGWLGWPPRKGAPAAWSRCGCCRRWRWPPGATRRARWPRWPRRWPWPHRRAMCACSPTRARRWPPCWTGSPPDAGVRSPPARACRRAGFASSGRRSSRPGRSPQRWGGGSPPRWRWRGWSSRSASGSSKCLGCWLWAGRTGRSPPSWWWRWIPSNGSQSCARQARRGQPHPGRRPRPGVRAARIAAAARTADSTLVRSRVGAVLNVADDLHAATPPEQHQRRDHTGKRPAGQHDQVTGNHRWAEGCCSARVAASIMGWAGR